MEGLYPYEAFETQLVYPNSTIEFKYLFFSLPNRDVEVRSNSLQLDRHVYSQEQADHLIQSLKSDSHRTVLELDPLDYPRISVITFEDADVITARPDNRLIQELPAEETKKVEDPKPNPEKGPDTRVDSPNPQTEEKSLLKEIFFGDFYKGQGSVLGTGATIGIGLLPIVGQIADARDTSAAIKGIWDEPASWAAWGNLGLAGIGWIPGIGDAIKGAKKVEKVGKEVIEKGGKEIIEKGFKEAEEKLVKHEKQIDQTLRATEKNAAHETSFKGLIDNHALGNDRWWIDRLDKAREFDIGGYSQLQARSSRNPLAVGRKGDVLDSDEVVQNLFWRKLYGVKRKSALMKDNPAMALTKKTHKFKDLDSNSIRGLNAEQVLAHHIDEMKQSGKIPDYAIVIIDREARKYLKQKGLI